MPRKATAAAATAGDDGTFAEQMAPRRSTRIASQPSTGEVVPVAKPRATKKRTAEGAGEDTEDKETAKAKKAKADNVPEGEAEGSDEVAEPAPQLAPIDIGDTLPDLVLKNEKEEDVQVADIAKEKGAVVFLVPKADTPGCTTQACGFRDIYSDFAQHGYNVYSLSADTPTALSKWQTKKELSYSLISDPSRILINALGAGEGGKTKRSHFIFAQGGKLVDKKVPVKPADSPKLALEFIKGATSGSS